ncbi:hypothetical protein ARMSODRAFT_976393 [Armillaria solidipes]|uniref:Uncharacterized protein n=1 Tax=Armillaria solidipes TaxID=1076256 RepID=A0A2H3BGT4_9AGAR|nr:hypothetical protein ARMSODRAFT_976393 [Armillaria solidipes]
MHILLSKVFHETLQQWPQPSLTSLAWNTWTKFFENANAPSSFSVHLYHSLDIIWGGIEERIPDAVEGDVDGLGLEMENKVVPQAVFISSEMTLRVGTTSNKGDGVALLSEEMAVDGEVVAREASIKEISPGVTATDKQDKEDHNCSICVQALLEWTIIPHEFCFGLDHCTTLLSLLGASLNTQITAVVARRTSGKDADESGLPVDKYLRKRRIIAA